MLTDDVIIRAHDSARNPRKNTKYNMYPNTALWKQIFSFTKATSTKSQCIF